jgi:hypothetical protein
MITLERSGSQTDSCLGVFVTKFAQRIGKLWQKKKNLAKLFTSTINSYVSNATRKGSIDEKGIVLRKMHVEQSQKKKRPICYMDQAR